MAMAGEYCPSDDPCKSLEFQAEKNPRGKVGHLSYSHNSVKKPIKLRYRQKSTKNLHWSQTITSRYGKNKLAKLWLKV
jgi:hypothetical protein